MNTYTMIYLAELWRRARLYLADFFWNTTFYLDEVFRHTTFYLAEQFRHATFYSVEQFRHAAFYLALLFQQIAFPYLTLLYWNYTAWKQPKFDFWIRAVSSLHINSMCINAAITSIASDSQK